MLHCLSSQSHTGFRLIQVWRSCSTSVNFENA